MRSFAPIVAWALLAASGCSPATRAFRLAAPSPDIVRYKIICEKSLQHCRTRAEAACQGPYSTLSSTASRTKPKRISSEPSPRSVGPRYQHERWFGTLLVDCHNGTERASAVADRGTTPPNSAAASPSNPAAAGITQSQKPTERLCVPGETQACLGPGACRGAQACNPEGLGFLPCDCGNSSQTSTATRLSSPVTP